MHGFVEFFILLIAVFMIRMLNGHRFLQVDINSCINAVENVSHYEANAIIGQPHLGSALVTLSARTQIQCATFCYQFGECTQAYFNRDQKLCSLMNDAVLGFSNSSGNDKGTILTQYSEKNNKFLAMKGASVCSVETCQTEGSCRKDCTKNESICLDDNYGCTELPLGNTHAYYYWAIDEEADNIAVKTWTYNKIYANTGLRVMITSNFRASHAQADNCNRWFITFNDQECTNPAPIDFIFYQPVGRNYLWPGDMVGICYGIPIGPVSIKFRIQTCSGYTNANGHTGWQTSTYAFFQETELQHQLGGTGLTGTSTLSTYGGNTNGAECVFPFLYKNNVYNSCSGVNHDQLWCATTSNFDLDKKWGNCQDLCPALSVFNVHQFTSTQENTADTNATLYEFIYTKRATDTGVRMWFNGVIWLSTDLNTDDRCIRWYFTFDDVECSDPVTIDNLIKFQPSSNYGDAHRGAHTTASVEGICKGLGAGPINVKLKIGPCRYKPFNGGDANTGWKGVTHIIAEEIRLGNSINAVVNKDGSIYRVPVFNIQEWAESKWNLATDVGLLKTFTYTKMVSYSTLKIRFIGNLRIRRNDDKWEYVAAWYFHINDAHCANPGKLWYQLYQDKDHDWFRPAAMDGYCKGIPAGTVTIKMYVEKGLQYPKKGNAYTGMNSATRVRVEEINLAN